MLEVARNKNLGSDFIQADMTDLPFEEEFDAVIMYGQPLSHLESAERVNSAANSIYNVLNPEGILISDFFTADAGKKDDIDSAEIEAGDYSISMFPRFTDYDEENQSWEGSIMFNIQKGNLAQVLQDDHQLRGYSLTQLEKIMSDAGFNGIEEEKIFAGDRVNSFVAYKGSEPKPDQQLGFSL
jgi:SAM-dependent methyltransferase